MELAWKTVLRLLLAKKIFSAAHQRHLRLSGMQNGSESYIVVKASSIHDVERVDGTLKLHLPCRIRHNNKTHTRGQGSE